MRVRPPADDLWGPTVAVLDAAAHEQDVLATALDELRAYLGADRADGGFVRPTDGAYRPSAMVSASGEVPAPFSIPGGDGVIASVLASDRTQAFAEVEHELIAGPCRDTVVGGGTRSMVVRRLEVGADPIGLMCFDWTSSVHLAHDEQLELVDLFSRTVLEPVLSLVGEVACRRPRPGDALTAGERDVVRLAAKGLSYRQIAHALDRSVHTIDHQLLSARRRVGARNTAQLVQLLAAELDDG